jgi:rubredoxin
VSAKTSFFVCGRCGFLNHPRQAPVAYKERPDGLYEAVRGDLLCEQCGAPNAHPDAVDYTPGAR